MSRFATIAKTASGTSRARRFSPAALNSSSRWSREKYAATAATPPKAGADSALNGEAPIRPRRPESASTMRSSSPEAMSSDSSPRRATTRWRTRGPSRKDSTRVK